MKKRFHDLSTVAPDASEHTPEVLQQLVTRDVEKYRKLLAVKKKPKYVSRSPELARVTVDLARKLTPSPARVMAATPAMTSTRPSARLDGTVSPSSSDRQADADRNAQIALRVGGQRAEPRQAHVEQHQSERAGENPHGDDGDQRFGVGRKVQGWSTISAAGSSSRPPNSSEPAATTIGSYSVSRSPKIVAQANETVASRITSRRRYCRRGRPARRGR